MKLQDDGGTAIRTVEVNLSEAWYLAELSSSGA